MITLPEFSVPVFEESVVNEGGTTYALGIRPEGGKALIVRGLTAGFEGEAAESGLLVCPLTAANARALRARLPWLNPVPLGLATSAGFGDRLGIATPGHVQAARGTGVAPIFAQQSVRENTRTGRTPQQVVDDATWGVFQAGWRAAWGADADHMKHLTDVPSFVQAGYRFFTIDPGDRVDDAADSDGLAVLREKVTRLPWDVLHSTLAETQARYQRGFDLETRRLDFDETTLLRALAKYGAAVAHTVQMTSRIQAELGGRPFDLEMSVDETGTATSLHEHFYIASELRRLGVPFVSLAPRFVGRFEKGVDYIGDLGELEANIAGHAEIIRTFGDSYKLSLHTGSDKFTVYPLAARHARGLVHLKTAGTSYLEALRLVANADVPLFRTILDFARAHYEEDRKTYHVSAVLDRVPAAAGLTDAQLPGLLDQFDARQVLHVTFGSVLDTFGAALMPLLRGREAEYHAFLKRHFDRHLAPFVKG